MGIKIKLVGRFDGDKVIVTSKKVIDHLHSRDVGERYENYLILDPYEAFYLVETRNMQIIKGKCVLTKDEFVEKLMSTIKEEYFMHKYHVYSDFKNRGYSIKTGLKFGFDFRVYPKGQRVDDSHTKYVVLVWPEERDVDTKTIARSIRMSLGLHTKFILAVVDNELELSYYTMLREKL